MSTYAENGGEPRKVLDAESGGGPRKLLPIIYVLDTSVSMGFETSNGRPIDALNAAMRETMKVLKEKELGNPRAKIKVGVVMFSSGAEWITGAGIGLEELEHFFWDDVGTKPCTDLGAALRLLYDRLSRSDVIRDVDTLGYCRPAIIFISDGAPTDDWKSGLEKAMRNEWFANAMRISMAVGEMAKPGTQAWDVLCKIATEESVIAITDIEALSHIIQVVSMSVSKWNSKSSSQKSNPVAEAMKELENQKDCLSGELTPEQESDIDSEVDDL